MYINKIKIILMIIVAIMALGVIGGYAYVGYQRDYCKDEIPGVTSIYVYTVDKGVGDLNKTYMRGKGYVIPTEDIRYITYQDIPTIEATSNVQSVYIFDDAEFAALTDGFTSGEITEVNVAVPKDAIAYYGAPSGLSYMFNLDLSQMPQTYTEYAVIHCTASSCEWSTDAVDENTCMLYYKYDRETWGAFNDKLIQYILANDAESEVSMLITTISDSQEDSAKLQNVLIQNFPGSNYLSAEFARVFRDKTNGELGSRIATFAGVAVVIAIAIEIGIAVSDKRAKNPRK